MPLRLTVRFTSPEAADGSMLHRVRNFAEDLQCAVIRDGIGQVENMDSAVLSVSLLVDSKRQLGTASELVRATLDRHSLSEGTLIER